MSILLAFNMKAEEVQIFKKPLSQVSDVYEPFPQKNAQTHRLYQRRSHTKSDGGGGGEEVMRREKLAVRLPEVSRTVSLPAIWQSSSLLAAQMGQLKLHSPSGFLSSPSKPLPQHSISSSLLSLSPQSVQLSCWFFSPYEALSVTGSFADSLISFFNLLFGKIAQKPK